MKRLFMKIRSFFVNDPVEPYTWTVEDFEAAKKWAKSQPDPENKNQSIWDRAYKSGWNESAYILAEINRHLKNKTNSKTTI